MRIRGVMFTFLDFFINRVTRDGAGTMVTLEKIRE